MIDRTTEDYKLPLIIYDENCALCKRFKDGLQFMDKDKLLNFVPLHQDQEIYNHFPNLNRESCQQTVHLIGTEGDIYQGAEVVEYLVKILPAVRKLAWLIETEMGQKTVQFFYEKVNQLRQSRFVPCSDCKK